MRTKQEIQQKAEFILANISAKYPVQIVSVAESLGLSVYKTRFSRQEIAGMLRVKEKAIYVNRDDGIQRRRFSVAHEIGHFVLHYHAEISQEEHVSYRDNVSSYGFNMQEIEANFFAANLLMPESEVKKLHEKFYTLEQMSDYFDVSKPAMGYRLKFLELDSE